MVLGRQFTDDDNYYTSVQVDELMFFNRNLSASDIEAFYHLYQWTLAHNSPIFVLISNMLESDSKFRIVYVVALDLLLFQFRLSRFALYK